MTVLDALKQAMDVLNGISVPMPQLRTIGMPIGQAMELIQASVDALEKNMAASEEPKDTEPDIEVVPVDEVPENA